MPAIQPAKLKQQIAELIPFVGDPNRFVHHLAELLELYADRVRRPGQSGTPSPLLPSYSVPSPVLRQIVVNLSPHSLEDPEGILALCDTLWGSGVFEMRLIAARLLGTFPPEPLHPLMERFLQWAIPQEDAEILATLFGEGIAKLRSLHAARFMEIIADWLDETQPTSTQTLGLQALLAFAGDRDFENLPRMFRLLTPFIRDPHVDLRPHILSVLDMLAKRSPQETAFLLQQSMRTSENPSTRWLARQVLPRLPRAVQENLRTAMKS